MTTDTRKTELQSQGWLRRIACIMAGAFVPVIIAAAEPAGEMDEVNRWAAAAFGRPLAVAHAARPVDTDNLRVLTSSHKVLGNVSVWGTPLTLGGRAYVHGLYMDAPASVRIHLSRPAVELAANVGIDENNDTKGHPQAGSARFHVSVEGQRVFSTPVLQLADGPKTVAVALGGVRDFVLEVDDGGDGRGWDQCDWAEAQVKLDDGSIRRLGDLVMTELPANRSNAPFSFLYDGRPSDELLSGWEFTENPEPAERGSQRLLTYRCPKTGLKVECVVTTYPDSPAVNWVCWLTNEGSADTPIIEGFMPLNASLLETKPNQSVTLRWSHGDGCTAESFLPHDEPLKTDQPRSFTGHSSDTACLPFFNLADADGGWILGIGWTGPWRAEFKHNSQGRVNVTAGMPCTRFRLRPGERVRTARIVLLRYRGPLIAGHNQFRRFMFRHIVPRLDGKPIQPPVACNSTAGLWLKSKRTGQPLGGLTETTELALIDRVAKLGCEAYWMDAYWFPQPWWQGNCGNWYPRPDDFPRGLRPLGDAAHERGMTFILWFASLHVAKGTVWARNQPQFIHGGEAGGGWKLADPQARQFLVDFLTEKARDWKFDVYREDFGTPLPVDEGPDRIGVAAMQQIEGFYAFWSGLRQRNPRMAIDNCSGGGRRIDFETASLAYTLWRSDFNDVGEGLKDQAHWPRMGLADQVMVTGLSLYFPLHTGPVWDVRPYNFRSAMTAGIVIYTDIDEDKGFSSELARLGIGELKSLRPLWEGDFYPLLPLTTSQRDWYAYQLDRPDLGEGAVLVFRRPESPDEARTIRLEQIDPQADYLVSLTGETYVPGPLTKTRGSAFQEMKVQIVASPGSSLIRYKRARDKTVSRPDTVHRGRAVPAAPMPSAS